VRNGIRYLLSAFQQLQCSTKRLILVGSILPEVEELIESCQQDTRISILGHVPQQKIKEIMSASLPSIEEGLACVQAQAMACGCPVIASQNTGAEDLFTDGKEGFTVPICDSAAIASRLQMLADDRYVRSRMSSAALERVKSIGGWEGYGETMYQLFAELIEA